MPAAVTTPAAARCPLCGQPNHCALAAGQPAHTCWCMKAAIAPEALQRLGAAQRGPTCICPACAQSAPAPAPCQPPAPA